MGLFFELLSSINNPHQTGKIQDLSEVISSVSTMANRQGVEDQNMQQIISELNGPLRASLQNTSSTLTQFTPDASKPLVKNLLGQLINAGQLNQIASQTGISSAQLQTMIPILIPILMKLFKMGQNSSRPDRNGLLESFLSNETTDLGEIFQYAPRLLSTALA